MELDVRRIKAAICLRGKTQTQVARDAGISRQSLSTILGRGTCSYKSALRIASALELQLTDLIREGQ